MYSDCYKANGALRKRLLAELIQQHWMQPDCNFDFKTWHMNI